MEGNRNRRQGQAGPRKLSQGGLACLIGASLAAGVGVALHLFAFGSGLANWSYDLLQVARPHIPADEAVLVYLDEESHAALQQPLNKAWDRALHARLVQRLTAAGARAIVFDVVFSDANPDRPEADQQLARSIKAHGKVVLAADHVRLEEGTTFTLPFDLLRTHMADMGSAEVVPSRDMVVRQHTPNDPLPSLSWAAAQLVGAKPIEDKTLSSANRWVNYYGPANFLPAASYFKALDPAALPDEFFSNKVVFVGARILTKFAGERKDEYRTPFTYWDSKRGSRDLFITGVEIQATMFLNLLRGEWLVRLPLAAEGSFILVCGLVLGVGLVRLRALRATLVGVGAAIVGAVSAYLVFLYTRTWFPWMILVVQVALAWLWSIVFNSIRLYIQKRLYEQTLALYLSPKLVKKFATNPAFLRPGAEKQTLTILFTDIANFTSISEGMDSDELARVMNRYFQKAVTHCIHSTDGTVVKYIGDAIFAFWNAPETQTDHALRACQAALQFARQEPIILNGRPLLTRLGLHTGEANVGNFGSTERVDYTALGENINLASRMEGLNKYLGTTVLATGDTFAAVTGRIVSRCCGRFRLKGFEKAVEVHELIGSGAEAEVTGPWREAFAEALRRFQQHDFAAAEAGFRRTQEFHPGDGPSSFYLARLDEFRHRPPPVDWAGEVELSEK